ncbi:MAG: hypothetical protein M0Z32_05445 [Actinomycetota bacterium]|nr:hypothetical protein [Actinomycetota bacterium]MCL6093909.1 hypothetical protein [Actinomycetota bacterium]MDA8167178.1 hypothetical protein [Actinomycetota bacterium]
MQTRSKFLLRSTVIVLGLMLALGLYLSLSYSSRANGIGVSDWTKLQQYVDAYIQRQYTPNGEGEGSVTQNKEGFYVNQAGLHGMLDSNGDGTILGEGDDLAKAPVLIDNLSGFTTLIPGTSFRCNWNTSCFGASAVADIRGEVDAHEAATGLVPDVINYCLTDHTAAPTTGALGYIAQTGALASDGSIPYVYGFTWGRDGWTNTPANGGATTTGGIYTYAKSNPVAAPAALGTYTEPSTVPGSCTSGSGDAELVRCAAAWAIGSTAGNVGNGQIPGGASPAQTLTGGQIVDIRSDMPGQTVQAGSVTANEVPINTIFNTGLLNVNPSATGGVLIASASQGPGGIVAEGLKMLGYATATGGYIHSGVPYWNNTMSVSQGQPNTGVSYALLTGVSASVPGTSAATGFSDVDSSGVACATCAGPTISSPSATATSSTTATVSRTTSVPSTTKIDLNGSDGSSVHVNNTILHASDTENLTGLHAGVTYTGTLTAYNGLAYPSSTPISFSTCAGGQPGLSLAVTGATWGSLANYNAGLLTVSFKMSDSVNAAYNVQITAVSGTNGVTLNTALPYTVGSGSIAAGGSLGFSLQYNVPSGVSLFHTSLSASAADVCGSTYTYGPPAA